MEERIVAAAIELKGVIHSMPKPTRHHDLLQHTAGWGGSGLILSPLAGGTQGFLTSEGRFVDRREALEIARAANQASKTLDPRSLFTEDLW